MNKHFTAVYLDSLFFHRVKVGMHAGTCVNWLLINSLVWVTVVTRLWWFFFGNRYILKLSCFASTGTRCYAKLCFYFEMWKQVLKADVGKNCNIKLLLPLLIMHKTQVSCTCFLFEHGLLLHSSYTRWMCPWVKCWPQQSWTVMLPVCCMTSPTLAPLSFVLACTWSVPCVVDCFIANSFQLIVFLHC